MPKTSDPVAEACEEIMARIDQLSEPDEMSREQAIELMEEIESSCSSRREAMKADQRREERPK